MENMPFLKPKEYRGNGEAGDEVTGMKFSFLPLGCMCWKKHEESVDKVFYQPVERKVKSCIQGPQELIGYLSHFSSKTFDKRMFWLGLKW